MLRHTLTGLTDTESGEIIDYKPLSTPPRRLSRPKRYKHRAAPKDTFWQAVALASLLTALIITSA
jgi:hypothetical protein